MKNKLLIILLSVSFFATAQTGITWSPAVSVSNMNMYSNLHPRIMLDGSGEPMVLWSKSSTKKVAFSRWSGNTFTTPVYLNPSPIDIFTSSWAGPDFASKGDTVYVVFKREPEIYDTNYIYIVRSFDGGANFSAPIRVDMIGNKISRFPTITVDNIGNPIVAFMKIDANFMNPKWVVVKSTDYGSTFSMDVLASGYSGGNGDICDCCPGAIVASGNNVAMLYRDNLNNMRDIWAGVSTNGATSFPSGMNIDQNNWMVNACPSTGPDGIIVGDTLYSVLMNQANGPALVYSGKASLSAMQGGLALNITGVLPGIIQQNFPRIANNGYVAAEVWKQVVTGGDAQIALKFSTNIQNGFIAGFDTVASSMANDIENADVAIGYGAVHVVWQDNSSGTVKYSKGTFIPSGISNDLGKKTISVYPNPFENEINIKLNSTNDFSVEILNTLGENVFYAHGQSKVNTSKLANGIYFIRVKQDNDLFMQKIIKQ